MKPLVTRGLALAGGLATSAFAAAPPVSVHPDGKLEIGLFFEASGERTNARTGARSQLTFSRGLTYVAVLRGSYSAAPGLRVPPSAEEAAPDMRRFLNLVPQEEHGRHGRSCGTGTTTFLDVIEGMERSGEGALVPFRREMRGGGVFPSGDRTVPERDLCLTTVSIDYARKVFHIRVDGSDSNVKVRAFRDGTEDGTAFNLPLQGYDYDGSVKAKLIFFDVPLPAADAGKGAKIEGSRVIERFNPVGAPDGSTFPLRATVTWRLTVD